MAETTVPPTLNILSPLPRPSVDEIVDALVQANGIRLARIVSHGQPSPAGFWCDQEEAEWVLIVAGRARVTIEGEAEDRDLGPGDSLFLPAHCRHRVAWTDPDRTTIWLALFVDIGLAPMAAS